MANELMSKINEAEMLFDERVKSANQEAAKLIEDAQKQAEIIISDGEDKAIRIAKAKISLANQKAETVLSEAEAKTAKDIEEMKRSSMGKESAAVLAVSKKLLELS